MNWTGTLLSGYGLWDQADRLGDLGANISDQLMNMSDEYQNAARFTPFGVSGYGGSAQGSETGVNFNLAPEQQAMADMLRTGSAGMFSSAMAPQQDRINSMYETIRAAQRPEEQRQGLAMESRLMGQGRGGIRSAAYGGAPEQLAYAKAVEEAKNNAALAAIGEARAQQAQDATIGGQMQTAQFLPQAQLLNMFNPGLQTAQLAQAGQLGGLNLGAQLGLGAMQTQTNAEKVRAELMANLFSTLGTSANNANFDPVGGLFDYLGSIF